MTDRFYPGIQLTDLLPLRAIAGYLEDDPGYLSDPECPYPTDVKLFLARLAPVPGEGEDGNGVRIDINSVNFEDLDVGQEAAEVYMALKAAGNNLEKSESSEKMSYFRTSTTLLQKLLEIKERATSLKEVAEFQSTVMALLEDLATPEQRTAFMERLKAYF